MAPWIAAILQTGVNVGILVAVLANFLLASAPPRYIFLVGILPPLRCFGFAARCLNRRNGHVAKAKAHHNEPKLRELSKVMRAASTIRVMIVCGHIADGSLGVHVLASTTPAESA